MYQSAAFFQEQKDEGKTKSEMTVEKKFTTIQRNFQTLLGATKHHPKGWNINLALRTFNSDLQWRKLKPHFHTRYDLTAYRNRGWLTFSLWLKLNSLLFFHDENLSHPP